ncbi:MAG: hypothetical protein WBI07_10820 [Mobilitalea sp.]
MKKIVKRYQISKFNRFTNGLIFAVIAIIALSLCLIDIVNNNSSQTAVILPFGIAIISMLFGFYAMFRNNTVIKEIQS